MDQCNWKVKRPRSFVNTGVRREAQEARGAQIPGQCPWKYLLGCSFSEETKVRENVQWQFGCAQFSFGPVWAHSRNFPNLHFLFKFLTCLVFLSWKCFYSIGEKKRNPAQQMHQHLSVLTDDELSPKVSIFTDFFISCETGNLKHQNWREVAEI